MRELADVLLAPEWPRARRMCAGNGQLIGDHLAALERHLRARPEGLLGRVVRVVTAGPLRILDSGDLLPQLDGVRPVRTLRGIGEFVVPGAVLQRDGED